MKSAQTFFILLILFDFGAAGAATHPTFSQETYTSDSGNVTLSWTSDNQSVVQVLQSDEMTFENERIIYEGQNQSVFVTGLHDGTYYFRVRPFQGEAQSETKLTVSHHSMTKAWSLLGAGLLTFLCTLGVLVRGHRRES